MGNTGVGRIFGVITADAALAATLSLAGDPAHEPLTGAGVRLLSPSGEILFDSRTDARGEFKIAADAGVYTLEIAPAGGETFVLELEVEAGEHIFVQAHVRGNPDRPVIDAEMFTDDDGDGVSDSGVSIRIVGREAGRPASGQTIEEDHPDEDLEQEEQGSEDGEPASLADFEEGQRVFAKGSGEETGFVADEVHGNSGRSERACRLSGVLTGVQEGPEGVGAVELFGVTVDLEGAHLTGVRGGGGVGSFLAEGTRVEIHANPDDDGTLDATRLHARNNGGGSDERISGRLTAPPDSGAGTLEVCGVTVTVPETARITNGDGGGDGDGDDDGDGGDDGNDGNDGGDGDGDDELSFEELVVALAGGAFNHDARGAFVAGTLRLDKLAASESDHGEIEIIGEITDVNAGAGTFLVLGLPLVVDAGTEFEGNLQGPADILGGLRVRAEVEVEDGALSVRRIQRAGEPHDRLRGGALTLVSSDLTADVNVAIELGGGITLPADVLAGTELELED